MRPAVINGYAPVYGLKMYYEIHGKGAPLVLIHGGGSTIQTTFGRVIQAFAAERQVIAVELQGHGHTPDRDLPESFEQDGDQDVIRPEHAVEIFRLLSRARLTIIPGPHGASIGEITNLKDNNKLPLIIISIIQEFLNGPL